MKILLTRSMLEGDIHYIKNCLDKHIKDRYEIIIPNDFTEESLCKEVVDVDVMLGPFVSKKILECAQKLQLIQVPWTGMDTFDFSAVTNCKIPICNTHSNADSVAEFGIAITLDLLKKVSYHDRKMRVGNWNRDQKPLDLKSRMVSKQNFCILGCGNIGYRMAKILKGFGATVIAVGGHEPDEFISLKYKREDLVDALEVADILVCTLPLTDETRGLIDYELLKKCKPGILVVNLSRASIVDEDSMYSALNEGIVGGFASDVWWSTPKRGETESYPSNNKFWEMDNVVMSPHRAGFIENSLPHLDEAVENIIRLANREKLINVIDINKHY